MGFPKPLLKIDSTTFIEQTLQRVMATVPSAVVVLGAHAERVRAAIPDDPRIKIAVNKNYLQGQLSSLRVGLRALGGDEDGALVHLADHPLVKRETFDAVIDLYEKAGAQIVI